MAKNNFDDNPKKTFSFQWFDGRHYQTTEQYTAAVDALFAQATLEVAKIAATENYNPNKPFNFDDYPKTKAKVREVVGRLATNMTAVVSDGTRREWLYACKKNDEFIASILDCSKLGKERLQEMQDRNLDAMHTFQQRKINGMDLSQRVWKYVGQYKEQIEHGLDVGLGEGRSAQQLSRDLRQNLQDPDRLFRRVRDKHGNLQLSKAAKAFNPGQGVYRSAYKNAMRLTRTEINMAYRESDQLRWQQLDFVVGFEVHRTQRSKKFDCKLCDKLVGRYPKQFKFKGWHPQCMCYATAILMDDETFDEQELSDLKAALHGTEYKKLQAKNAVTDVPQGFKDWVAENEGKQAKWRSTPYFIRDNFKNGNLADGLKFMPKKRIKTEQEKTEIQMRWNSRVASRKYNEQLHEIGKKYGNESEAINKFINKIKSEIQTGADISEIDSLVSKLNHKVQIKSAWDERREINRLETLLVDVKGLKSKFDMPAIKAVFDAVEKKLDIWKNLPLEKQLHKLKYEIQWVESNKKYDTWQVAQSAYKKRLLTVEYLIGKQDIQTDTASALAFANTTKSAKVKQLVAELKGLLSGNAPIADLKQKAMTLNNEVAKLEAAKAMRDAKKAVATVDFDESNFTHERKDAAMWEKTSSKKADAKVRGVCENVWQNATPDERDGSHFYTHTYSSINEPLRGIPYLGGKDIQLAQSKVPHITSLINKSSYNFDIWLQRGVGIDGFRGLFGVDLYGKTEAEARQLLMGKTGIDKGFSSCAIVKDKGFSSKPVIYNIYCPKGTKMLYMEPFSAFGHGSGASWDGKTKQQRFGSEIEMVLQRGTKFRVIKVEKTGSKWFIDIEVIGQM